MYLILTSILLEGMPGLDPLFYQQDIKVKVKVSMCKQEIVRRGGGVNE
jgi:hypothetical protein